MLLAQECSVVKQNNGLPSGYKQEKNIHAHDNGYGCATLVVQMTAASVTHGSYDPTTVEAKPVAGEQWASAGRTTGVGAHVCLLPASRRRPA